MSQGPSKDDKPTAADPVPPPARAESTAPATCADARPASGPGSAPPPLPMSLSRSPQPVLTATGAATAAALAPLAPAPISDPATNKATAPSSPPLNVPLALAGPRKAPDRPGPVVAPRAGAKVVEVGAPPTAPKAEQPAPPAAATGKTPPPSATRPPALPPTKPAAVEAEDVAPGRSGGSSRSSRRRPAGPSRAAIAANDDVPSIGGLIYALQQKPSQRPMMAAAIASGVWGLLSLLLGWAMLAPELQRAPTFLEMLSRPTAITLAATIIIPIALFWFLAMLVWRAQELRLMSSAMTEVAIRLAEPDRMAEQQIASVGQAVRRQVSFMNEAVSRALGRAGELEALVHSEVAALERAYSENEHRIRGLLTELSGERHALLNTSERVNQALKEIGTEIPSLVDKLGQQQLKLAGFIEGAGQNLIALETSLASTAENVSNKLGDQTSRIETVFEEFTTTLSGALEQRTENLRLSFEHMTSTFDERTRAIDNGIAMRTENLQAVFEQYANALDTTMANRQEAIDRQLIERTRVLDDAFSERLRLFDESILRSTLAIDGAVADKALALTQALEGHALQIGDVLGSQAEAFDGQVLHGVQAVRKASEAVTRQSMAAIEGLAGQADMLKHVSENLLGQINNVTGRFEAQGRVIMTAADALEGANSRIDRTLQARQVDLASTLEQLSGKAGDIDRAMRGYSTQLEGSIAEAETRAKQVGEQLTRGAKEQARLTLSEMDRLRVSAGSETDRALDELRAKFSNVTREVDEHIGTLSSRFNATSEDMRVQARAALADLEAEQGRLKEQLERLPETTRASTESMRRTLQDQLRALQQLSTLTTRETSRRDVMPPAQLPSPASVQQAASSARHNAAIAEAQAAQARAQSAATAGGGRGEGWKLGELLARASEDEAAGRARPAASSHTTGHTGGHTGGHPAAHPASSHAASTHAATARPAATDDVGINVPGIAKSLDATTAAAIWSRFRTGQRGIMVRSIYSNEGRTIFDEVQRRCRSEAPFKATVERYLVDFEHVLREADQQDPAGRLTQSYVVSDGGRVYLFLAHAAGRLA